VKTDEPGGTGEGPEEFEEGAGEGSRAPSTERIYNDPNRYPSSGGAGWGAVIFLGGVGLIAAVAAAPVEAAGAVVVGGVALANAL
jgi:hypothetical protein